VHAVGNGLLAIRRKFRRELGRVALLLGVFGGAGADDPIVSPVHVLDHLHFHGFLLMVAQLDLVAFVHPLPHTIGFEFRAAALGDDVEGVSRIDAQGFIFWRVLDFVLADELQTSLVIAPVKTHSPLGQRHSQMIGLRVAKFAHHVNPFIGRKANLRLLGEVLPIGSAISGNIEGVAFDQRHPHTLLQGHSWGAPG
jgi:hypothetical protein